MSVSMIDRVRHIPARRVAGLFGAAMLVAACGGSTTTEAPGTPAIPSANASGLGAAIDVTESDYKIDASTTTTAPGQVTFHVTNSGSQTHEFVVIRTDTAADQLPTASGGGEVDEDAGGMEVVDEVEDLAPGASQDLTVNLDAGHYALICNVPAHYELGMHADFTVAE